jgi:hypothetical protein
MTVRRIDEQIAIEGVCTIEDAEALMRELQDASVVEWSQCTHLHTACLQVLLAARAKMLGGPSNLLLTRWVAPLLDRDAGLVQRVSAQEAENITLVPAES